MAKAKKAKLGSGERFEAMVQAIMRRKDFVPKRPSSIPPEKWEKMSEQERKRASAEAIAAAQGRRKYGKKRMQQWAVAGLRRYLKKRGK